MAPSVLLMLSRKILDLSSQHKWKPPVWVPELVRIIAPIVAKGPRAASWNMAGKARGYFLAASQRHP